MAKCYTYQNILTKDGTNLCLTDTGAKKGRNWHSPGRTIIINMKDVNVCPVCAMGELGPFWGGGKELPEVEGQGFL